MRSMFHSPSTLHTKMDYELTFQRYLSRFLLCLSLLLHCNSTFASDSSINPNEWCPDTNCHNTGNCRPCERKWLFIIAQGRSGSTTLKNMLNLLPGVRLNGEMGNTTEKMQNLWTYVHEDFHLAWASGTMERAWGHNPYNSELSCAAQKFIEAMNPPQNNEDQNKPEDILGFKEIRVNNLERLEVLLKHLTCSRFIFSIRSDTEELTASQKSAFGSSLNNQLIPRLHKDLQKRICDKRVYLMDMSHWKDEKNGSKYFDDLATWLGFANCKFPRVLHDNVIIGWRWTSDKNRFQFDSSCRYMD